MDLTEHDLERLVFMDAATLKPCTLCGAPTQNRSVFVPNDSRKYGAGAGKQRYIIYPLCEEENRQDASNLDRIEQIIKADIAIGSFGYVTTHDSLQ